MRVKVRDEHEILNFNQGLLNHVMNDFLASTTNYRQIFEWFNSKCVI